MVIFSASIRAVADGKPVTNWRRNSDNSNKNTRSAVSGSGIFYNKIESFQARCQTRASGIVQKKSIADGMGCAMMEWDIVRFEQLDTYTLYAMLQLRVDVFVVEQNCPYPELDDKDLHPQTKHILLKKAGKILAYARVLPPDVSFAGVARELAGFVSHKPPVVWV